MVWHCKPKSSSEITKNEDFLIRSKNLVRISFGLSKNHKIMSQLSKLDFSEFFMCGVGIELANRVYMYRLRMGGVCALTHPYGCPYVLIQ